MSTPVVGAAAASAAASPSASGAQQFCQDLVTRLMLQDVGAGDVGGEEPQQIDVRTRVMSYLTYVEGLQLSGEGDDKATSERLSSASAVFLALYEQPHTPVGGGSGGCRLGELLRQSNVGVKDFMEHLTLLASRLPQPLSGQLQADLRVMKEGIVVTKMLHGKYVQLWNRRNALLRTAPATSPPSNTAGTTATNGAVSEAASSGGASGASGSHNWSGDFEALSPPADPEALPRLGWYLYLFMKDVMGFDTSNALFVKCMQVMLASLGVVVWNASSPANSLSSCSTPPSVTAADKAGGKSKTSGPAAEQEEEERGATAQQQREATGGGSGVIERTQVATRTTRSSVAATAAAGAGMGQEDGGTERAESSDGADIHGKGGGGGRGSEKLLLAALSASGRCSTEEVRAMSVRVVEVVEALLEEGALISVYSAGVPPFGPADDTSPAAGHAGPPSGPGVATGETAASARAVGGDDTDEIPPAQGMSSSGLLLTSPTSVGVSGDGAAGGQQSVPAAAGDGIASEGGNDVQKEHSAGEDVRQGRLTGVFHPSVASENAARLEECYWARVTEREVEAGDDGEGGIRVLDETFVLTPSLRDTVGTPRCGTSTPRRPALTPSVSRASRQLFQDYQRVSHAGGSSAAPSPTDLGGLGLSFGHGFPDTPSSAGGSQVTPGAATVGSASRAKAAGPGSGYLLESPVLRGSSSFGRGSGGRGSRGSPVASRPPATPVMAAMETVRWIAGLDAMTRGPGESLLQKLEKCSTASTSMIQERLAALMSKLDGPGSQQTPQNTGGMPFAGTAQAAGGAGGANVEARLLAEAKCKAESLYYATLEALLDAETRRLGSEDHSRLLRQETLHGAILACCLEAVLKASSLLSLTFPWVLRRMGIDALDLCKVLESFARFCPGLPGNVKHHLFEVQTEIVERLALEDGAGVFRLIVEHKAAGEWPVPALQETDVAPPTGARLASVNSATAAAATNSTNNSSHDRNASTPTNAAAGAAPTAATSAGKSERTETGSKSEVDGAAAAEKVKAAAARARASTLDLYFRKLMKRAAEVVAELCLRRLQLPGDTADQVWTVMKRCVARRTEILKDRHLHHVVLCSTYSVCKVNSVTPEVTFKRIIEQYKQLSSAAAGGTLNGGVGTPRLSVIKDILLKPGDPEGGPAGEPGEQERGDIIKFYNKVYIPAMKQFVLEFKNLAGQQRGAASVSTAKDAVRVAKRALVRSSRDIPPRHANSPSSATTPTSSSKYQHDHEGRWQRGNASGDGNGDSSSSTSSTDANRHHHNYQGSSPHLHHRSRHRSGTGGGSGGRSRSTRSPTPSAMDQEENKKDSVDRRVTSGGGIDENSYGHQRRSGASPGGGGAADEEDVVAAGAALSALSSAPHPHTPLVSPLPSQRMASPKRVQENVYLTTVTSPPRGSGLGGGFSRPAPPADFSPRARAGGVRAGGDGDGGEGGGAGPGAVVTASAVYAFGQSPSKDLAKINRTVRTIGDDGLIHPPSAKKARPSSSPTSRTQR